MLKRMLISMSVMLMLCGWGASQAFGSFVIAVSLNGGAKTTVASGPDFTPLLGSVSFGGYSTDFSSATSINNVVSKLLTSNLNISNVSNVTNDVLNIYVTQTNYTLPIGPAITMQSAAGGSSPSASNLPTLAGLFQAFYDPTNSAFGTTNTTGLQNAGANGASFDTGSAFGTFISSNLYSVTSQLNIVLGVGESTNINSSISLSAVPVPAGLILVATVAPLVGLVWLRRRVAVA